MLQLEKLKKEYVTGDLKQTALNEVSLNFRDNEFVAILGPSGSGKTTLLNMIGGLDHYDSGNIIINGVSTQKYKERDWDSYRNHSIGFVFQNYNLIPHQTILSNVELALTISGIPKGERKKRALNALEQVGLREQHHKRPNQLSGGQMQRVAIARALVNEPDILLADEPTGALDSETSIQVMEILKEVAKDRLVIMVTHNAVLAETYANRIVHLMDGKILADTNPYEITKVSTLVENKKPNKASMSFTTALSLSFNNLRTKKGRTLLTAFAGSIGIIGIALILSLSNGVSNYMNDIQKNTMTSYPISIQAESVDLAGSFMEKHKDTFTTASANHALDAVYTTGADIETKASLANAVKHNDLTAFKAYLDQPDCAIHNYVGENGIVCSYDTKFDVYTYDPNQEWINTNGSSFEEDTSAQNTESGHHDLHGMFGGSNSSGMTREGSSNFQELIPGADENTLSNVITDNYEMVYGNWPASYDEVVLVLDINNEISTTTLYELGILPADDYRELQKQIEQGDEISLTEQKYDYETLCKQTFYLIPSCDTYEANAKGTFDQIPDTQMETLSEQAIKLNVVGIIRPKSLEDGIAITSPVGYTAALTQYLIDYVGKSPVVTAQTSDQEHNVLTGLLFTAPNDQAKIDDAKSYFGNLGISEKASLARQVMASMGEETDENGEKIDIASMSEEALAAEIDKYLENPEDKEMLEAYDQMIPSSTYDANMKSFGAVSLDSPSAINIYADSFENKEAISNCIEAYNQKADEDHQISYIDYVGTLMSSVTTIINVVSYVLMAFVAVSLIVSSIMIGIITYISVLERTKEIGILRAIGASRHNISQVFNAETFILGLCSGAIGIGITLLLLIPGNMIIHSLVGTTTVNASLPFTGSFVLIGLSVLLTLIGGFIPSKHAARKDPVRALRSE